MEDVIIGLFKLGGLWRQGGYSTLKDAAVGIVVAIVIVITIICVICMIYLSKIGVKRKRIKVYLVFQL